MSLIITRGYGRGGTGTGNVYQHIPPLEVALAPMPNLSTAINDAALTVAIGTTLQYGTLFDVALFDDDNYDVPTASTMPIIMIEVEDKSLSTTVTNRTLTVTVMD